MTKNLPVPTADDINKAHQFAKESAEMAVDHAINCGQMLAAKKSSLPHGEFQAWVEKNCEFSDRQARRYMQAASKTDTRDRFDSLRQALGYDKPKPAPKETKPRQGAAPAETVTDLPKPEQLKAAKAKPEPAESDPDEPERPEWEQDEDAALELAERDYQERIDKAMDADDRLAEAFAQIKQQSALIATLTLARDSYMNSQGEAVRQLKKERNKVARLEKELDQLRKRAA